MATGDIRKYVVAEKRIGLALVLTVVATLFPSRFHLTIHIKYCRRSIAGCNELSNSI